MEKYNELIIEGIEKMCKGRLEFLNHHTKSIEEHKNTEDNEISEFF